MTNVSIPSGRPTHSGSTDRPVIYDMTRLLTRVLSDAPNGIDRVDLALARYFANHPGKENLALFWTVLGPRLFPAVVASEIVDRLDQHWRELEDEDDPLYEAIVRRIRDPISGQGRLQRRNRGSVRPFVAALCSRSLRFGRSPELEAPAGASYLNASHYPLEYERHLRWLFKRRDIAPAFFIHDLLPLQCPQYFWEREPERHRRRLEHIRRLNGRAIVSSATVAAQVRAHFSKESYEIPILEAALPVSPVFQRPRRVDDRLRERPYFVVCGTIEPRKNHILLLNIWRELITQSTDVPMLVVVGKRGWNAETIIGTLERSRSVSKHVVEVTGLSTPALKRLLDNAAALLAPSLSEGFGLPVQEALTTGLPVIASDIPVYRERATPGLELINSLDGAAWLSAIRKKGYGHTSLNPQRLGDCGFQSSVEQFLDEKR